MIPNKLLEYYELLVRHARPPTIENLHLREYVAEIRDVWEQRVILRELRIRANIPVCSGEVNCLEVPTSRCMSGVHQTCPDHTGSCYLCVPKGL
jgi:hypothetical protein